MKKAGQIGVEYLIVIAFVTFIVLTTFTLGIYYSGAIKDKIVSDQIENFAYNLINSAESVFFAGEPSEITLNLYLPSSVSNITIQNDGIVITSETSSGINVRFFESRVPLSGTISPTPGNKILKLKALSDRVEIVLP
ncbi:MAG: hypothetical protein QXI33_03630 [Candidatus Pacearchaeota archaeon]